MICQFNIGCHMSVYGQLRHVGLMSGVACQFKLECDMSF